jgi:hypothetical protein
MVLKKCGFSGNMQQVARKIQRRFKYLTGETVAPTIYGYRNYTLKNTHNNKGNFEFSGFDIDLNPYGQGKHAGHAVSAVKFRKTLFCFNAWGKRSLPKDRTVFDKIKKDHGCNRIVVYNGPYLQKGGVCVAFSSNFMLEMFLQIYKNKITPQLSQKSFDNLVEKLLLTRGICFGGKCINNEQLELQKNLNNRIATPTRVENLPLENLKIYAKNLGVPLHKGGLLKKQKTKNELLANIRTAQVKRFNVGRTPTLSTRVTNSPIYFNQMKVVNLKQYAKSKGLKGYSALKKQNLIRFTYTCTFTTVHSSFTTVHSSFSTVHSSFSTVHSSFSTVHSSFTSGSRNHYSCTCK